MDALSITVLCLIILVIASFIFLPMLKYKLGFRDVTKFYFNDRYQLFVYAHYHYAKVRSGKQSYDKYCNYIKQLYNKDNFNKAKSEHDNNRRRIDLCFLAGVLDDEQFVRSHFSCDSLPFEKFTQMNDEWEMRPIKTEPAIPEKAGKKAAAETDYDGRLSEKERRTPGSFNKLIIKKEKQQALTEWMDRTLASIYEGDEYNALILALKKSTLVQFSSTIELYECINASFQTKIKINYNALTNAMKLYREGGCSQETEEKTTGLIEQFTNELNEI